MEKSIQEKYIDLINELYRSFDFFNEYFCQGKLNKPLITLQGDKSPGTTYGWFGKEFWKDNREEGELNIDELNLTAESLHRSPEGVLQTLLHEISHLKNAQEMVMDCTPNQYHNENFKTAAEFFGLQVFRMNGKGWAGTSLDEKAREAIKQLQPKTELYKIVRTPPLVPKKLPTTISLNVSLDYEDIINDLLNHFEGKRQMAEEALSYLHRKYQKSSSNSDLGEKEES
jgi:hypothetical protein